MTERQTLQDRLKTTLTPRAQMGLVLLLALLGVVSLMELHARNIQLKQQLVTVSTELAGRRAALEQRDWTEVLASSSNELSEVQGRFWTANTAGLASAEILGAVEAAARQAELNNPRVAVLRSDTLTPGVVLFEVEVIARGNQGRFATFLEALTQADGELRPSELDWQGQNRPLTIRLVAPARIEEPTPS